MRSAMDGWTDCFRHISACLLGRYGRQLVDCARADWLGPWSSAWRGPISLLATKTQAEAAAFLGASSRGDRSDVARPPGWSGAIRLGRDYSSGVRRAVAFGVSSRG